MKTSEIGYLTEAPKEWANGLKQAKSLQELQLLVNDFAELCWDAKEIIDNLTNDGFISMQKAMARERRGSSNGPLGEQARTILMPKALFLVSMIAAQFHAPWGVAYKQLEKAGRITITDGKCEVDLSPRETA